ncbi:MAG TPA: hypothetical protein VLR26_18025 [Frankiaceae bacterium]|nr:hypothetical protein [Frankiaceae bacterium]
MSISGSTISRPTRARTTTTPKTTTASTATRSTGLAGATPPTALANVSCWRLLTARVPLTLLLDLALPSAEELAKIYDELLEEPTSVDWVPSHRR